MSISAALWLWRLMRRFVGRTSASFREGPRVRLRAVRSRSPHCRWWTQVGRIAYPNARRLLINADAGGSDGYRVRLCKLKLAKLATDTGLAITVGHYSPGTSKWNKIEHRLFSAITSNWRGRPLTSHQIVVDLIGATTTRTGLTAGAEADTNTYPGGIKVTDDQMSAIASQLKPDKFHGEWNYTVKPATPGPLPTTT